MDERDLWQAWDTFGSRLTWLNVLRHADTEQGQQIAQRTLDALKRVLVGRRWYVIQAAREAGASWNDVGTALGMSGQAAEDWYRDKIAHRERYVPDLHDATRARQALTDQPD